MLFPEGAAWGTARLFVFNDLEMTAWVNVITGPFLALPLLGAWIITRTTLSGPSTSTARGKGLTIELEQVRRRS